MEKFSLNRLIIFLISLNFLATNIVVASEEDLKNEIKALKYEIAKQNQRIKIIEDLLKSEDSKTPEKKVVNSGGWTKSWNWLKVKRNMTRQQVLSILGEPTEIQTPYPYGLPQQRRFVYQGQTDSGYISGHVDIDVDVNQVGMISRPVF